jgi:hypothetical protein
MGILNLNKQFEINIIELSTIIYLLIPMLLFLLYLQSLISITAIIISFISFYKIIKSIKIKPMILSKKTIIICFLFAIVFTFLCGGVAQVYGRESTDWHKHNTILKDLAKKEWPVVYDSGEALNYYIGFYLPAATIGRITSSYRLAKLALSGWIVIGLFLGFLNLLEFTKPNQKKLTYSVIILFIFMMYSGWDWLARLMTGEVIPHFPSHLEWGPFNKQYASIATSLVWVPQHLLSALLAIPFALRSYKMKILFIIPLVLLWSPFVAMAIFFIYLVSFLINLYEKTNANMNFYDIVISSVISLPLILFYLLHHKADLMPFIYGGINLYFTYIFAELGPIIIVIFLLFKLLGDRKKLIIFMLVPLIILPLFKFGNIGNNDLMIRVTTTLVIAILFILLKNMLILKKKWKLAICMILLLGGIIQPVYEIGFTMEQKKIAASREDIRKVIGYWQYYGYGDFNNSILDFFYQPRFFENRISHNLSTNNIGENGCTP